MVMETSPEGADLEGRLERFRTWLAQLQDSHRELEQRVALGGHNANRLQGRRISAAAPSAAAVLKWNATSKKYEPEAPSTAVAHTLDSTHHTDVTTMAEAAYDVLVRNAGNTAWDRLGLGGAATFLRSTGAALAYSAIQDADVPASHSGSAHHAQAHAAAQHNAAALPASANEDLGAFYLDIDDIAVPANPSASIRRLFVDTATGEISVRTSGGSTVSLEGGGGGTPTLIEDADQDTKVQAEESADEDVIRFDTAGFERAVITATGQITFGSSSRQFALNPGLSALGGNNYDGISLVPSSVNPTGSTRTLRGFNAQMTVDADGGTSGHKILGMRFLGGLGGGVLALNETNTASEVTACSLEPAAVLINFSGTKTVDITTMRGLWILPALSYIFEPSAAGTIATYMGIDVEPPASDANHITDYIGVQIDNTADPTGNIYLLNVGPSTPYFRVLGNFTAAANRTPVYISEGATPTLRQLRTIDPGAGGVNFVGGELVCELV